MNAQQVLESLRRSIVANERHVEIEQVEQRDGEFVLAVRYLGAWEVPADEEDDGDYDWKVPTEGTRRMFDAICAKFSTPTVTVRWQNEGEKCWMRFTAKE